MGWSVRPFLMPDEGRNAEKAREILLLRDWVTPYQNFLPTWINRCSSTGWWPIVWDFWLCRMVSAAARSVTCCRMPASGVSFRTR